MFKQPALAPSPQPRPAPTTRALPAECADQRGPFWMPIRGPTRTPIDRSSTRYRRGEGDCPCLSMVRTTIERKCEIHGGDRHAGGHHRQLCQQPHPSGLAATENGRVDIGRTSPRNRRRTKIDARPRYRTHLGEHGVSDYRLISVAIKLSRTVPIDCSLALKEEYLHRPAGRI